MTTPHLSPPATDATAEADPMSDRSEAAWLCSHDWEPFWDGSLGYTATDRCRVCGDYRPTPHANRRQPMAERFESESAAAKCHICGTTWRFNNAESARSWMTEHMASHHQSDNAEVSGE
jgi:hypothetical protein